MAADQVVLGIVIGTLAAIVYSLRVLILLERRIARMDLNIESLTRKVLTEEIHLAREESAIETELEVSSRPKKAKKVAKRKVTAKKSTKKPAKKKSTAKKTTKRRAKKATKKKTTKKRR